jgi:hypothetical protein
MNNFKYNLGPFEIFSNLLSGLFLMAGLCIIILPKSDFQELFSLFQSISVMPNLIVIIITGYIVGAGIGGFSYKYLKIACKIFRCDYISMENHLLKDINENQNKLTLTEFLELSFEKRLSYLVNQHVTFPKLSHVNDYLLPFLREKCENVAIKSETFIASSIMYRNLSLGFLVTAIGLISCIIFSEAELFTFLITTAVCIGFAILLFFRSLKFKEWWSREILLGFYYKNLEEIQQSSHLFLTAK